MYTAPLLGYYPSIAQFVDFTGSSTLTINTYAQYPVLASYFQVKVYIDGVQIYGGSPCCQSWIPININVSEISGTHELRILLQAISKPAATVRFTGISLPVTIAPAVLVPTIISLPTSVVSGSSVPFSFSVTNTGGSNSNPTTANITMNGSIVSTYNVGAIQPGNSITASSSFTATSSGVFNFCIVVG